MFKRNPNPTFVHEVELTIPGEAQPGKVNFTFRHKRRKDLDAWVKRPKDAEAAGTPINDADFLAEVIVSWDGVQDDDGSPWEFKKENFAEFLEDYPAAGNEIFEAYIKALTESRAKN